MHIILYCGYIIYIIIIITDRVIPSNTLALPQNDFGGVTVAIDTECSTVVVQRNMRVLTLRHCRGNASILSDGDMGVFDLTDGLQANELQQVYAWDVSETPEDPFVLYNFRDPVRVTTVVITFVLLQNYNVLEVPTITMFVSNTSREYPRQELNLKYDASRAPDTGVFRVKIAPLTNDFFHTWCIDMIAPLGTEWIIVSEIELYHEVQTGKHLNPITEHIMYMVRFHTKCFRVNVINCNTTDP